MFHPSIEGFNHCRPILSIDGTHLYGKYKGTLMIAMGYDENNQLFNIDSRGWFLACIRNKVCDAPKTGGPLTICQPAKNLYISYLETHT